MSKEIKFNKWMNYIDDLIPFLTEINENVNWRQILNEILPLPTKKMLSRIKSYVWTDKDLDIEDNSIGEYYLEYTNIIFDNFEELTKIGKNVLILGYLDDKNDEKNSFYIKNTVMAKTEVLKKLLEYKNIKYKVVYDDKEFNSNSIVFPTCLILYDKGSIDIKKAGKFINDSYYNIVKDDVEMEKNLFKILILELYGNSEANIDELCRFNVNFVII